MNRPPAISYCPVEIFLKMKPFGILECISKVFIVCHVLTRLGVYALFFCARSIPFFHPRSSSSRENPLFSYGVFYSAETFF